MKFSPKEPDIEHVYDSNNNISREEIFKSLINFETESDKKVIENTQCQQDENAVIYEDTNKDDQLSQKCLVIMPYGSKEEYSRGIDESDYVFNHIICPAVKELERKTNKKIKIIREVENSSLGSITRSVIKHIATSEICIVDITGLNPNVFFELGIRYSLKNKKTILLRQKTTEIPFDINGYRCITYDCFKPTKAISDLLQFLTSCYDDRSQVNDSLVFEVFPSMEVRIPGILTSIGELNEDYLSWDEWWEHIKELIKLLEDSIINGRFVPDVVFGISNGGLLVADLLGRELFKGSATPILSLWAHHATTNRNTADSNCYFFDNEYNRSIMEVLKRKQKKVKILLVDDVVFSFNTAIQASNFINRELNGNCEILFTPLLCNQIADSNLEIVEQMFPYGFKNKKGENVFSISKEEYLSTLHVNKKKFPYDKRLI